jgi:hypothetical protein
MEPAIITEEVVAAPIIVEGPYAPVVHPVPKPPTAIPNPYGYSTCGEGELLRAQMGRVSVLLIQHQDTK